MDNDRVRSSRRNYDAQSLDADSVLTNPFEQSALWIGEAVQHPELLEPNAMTVATVDAAGRPSARIVLLRGYDEHGFVFFTNYDSRKGLELAGNNHAALLFYWDRLERELRIEGSVERLHPQESDRYFASRPRGHRLSAWASPQSREVQSRQELEVAMSVIEERFPNEDVPRPEYWGGYRVRPHRYEFWQGRSNRLHDRIQYDLTGASWHMVRLAP
jgi:pyridoxamine 5'-phosphate oxidase